MAYSVTPGQSITNKCQPDKSSRGNHHWPTFTATDLDSTLRAATPTLDTRQMNGLTLHVKNSGANALTGFKIYSGVEVDANGDLSGLSAAPSDLMDASFARCNSVDPTTLAAGTEMDIVIDMNPMPPKCKVMAAADNASKANLEITVVGAHP